MGQPKYRQMIAQFKPKAGVTPQREPKDDPLVYRYGSQGRQEVNITKGLLTYVLDIEFSTAEKAVGKLWKVLDKMHVFDEWEAHAVFAPILEETEERLKELSNYRYTTLELPYGYKTRFSFETGTFEEKDTGPTSGLSIA
ncbi:hypothetical protein LB504_007373 [Fusarium proliferatum]|nr:hypothetical protein LB504_007373 [Fusarium proliferatum]